MVRGRPSGLQAAAHRCATALRAGLDPGASAAPGRQEAKGQAQGPAPGQRTAPAHGDPPDMVTTEGFIYQQRCDDPLNSRG